MRMNQSEVILKLRAVILFTIRTLILIVSVLLEVTAQAEERKARTIVTTDGEVDDQDSFIRMLLYTNEFNLAGLIYSSSQWHYKGDGKGTKYTSAMSMTAKRYGERTELRWPGTTWMEAHIDQYAMVYENLKKHAAGYPSPEYLKSIVRIGNIDLEGEMAHDTPGSDFIKQVLLDADTNVVYLQIWGGTNTVARALKSIEEQYKPQPDWQTIKQRVSRKAVLYTVLDQDITYTRYVAPNWPGIKVLYNAAQFWNFAYPWPRVVPLPLQQYLRGPWFDTNIRTQHGPLMEQYYLWGDGRQIENDPEHNQGDTAVARKAGMTRYDFISEGDSPAYFHLVDVGLNSLDDASFGGWGGRMVRSKSNPNRWEDGDNVTDFNPYTKRYDKAYPQTRWIEVLQEDFAARADWCVATVEEANHAPVVNLGHDRLLEGKPGRVINLAVNVSDPDEDQLSCKWWQYEEVDSYEGKIQIVNSSKLISSFKIPADARPGDTFHLVAEVSDNGKPKLTRYRRVIVTVK
ncbi:MAG TPA: DUF1593 domain-containing protein [Chryseolinea sp.]|nr:DUF1593 domain-containing protein [Chryseolinea sp.]